MQLIYLYTYQKRRFFSRNSHRDATLQKVYTYIYTVCIRGACKGGEYNGIISVRVTASRERSKHNARARLLLAIALDYLQLSTARGAIKHTARTYRRTRRTFAGRALKARCVWVLYIYIQHTGATGAPCHTALRRNAISWTVRIARAPLLTLEKEGREAFLFLYIYSWRYLSLSFAFRFSPFISRCEYRFIGYYWLRTWRAWKSFLLCTHTGYCCALFRRHGFSRGWEGVNCFRFIIAVRR